MAARLYANENFHRGVVDILRQLGHDVLTTLEAGHANRKIPDEEVVAFAKTESRAVLTFNRCQLPHPRGPSILKPASRRHFVIHPGHRGTIDAEKCLENSMPLREEGRFDCESDRN